MGALIAFVFVGLFSPGPNIVLLTASGARFGFRRTIPHLAGISLSVGSVAALTALGIAAALAARFAGVAWQRCQFHIQQNAQAYVPKADMKTGVAASIRRVFDAADRPEA